MKHVYALWHSTLVLLVLCPMVLFADETCDEALAEGKLKYNAGNYQKAKELFRFVQSECGNSYGDVQSWINRCDAALTPTLSVSNSYLSFSSSGGTQSITITSNRSWILSATGSQMFSVSSYGNSVTIRCNENTSTSSRNDYFIVQTTDGSKSIRINVSQSAAQGNTPTSYQVSQMRAKINSVRVEYNVMNNGVKGMRIHVNFNCDNMRTFKGWCIVWFYNANGTNMKNYSSSTYTSRDNFVGVWDTFISPYDSAVYSDFVLFIPNSAITGRGQNLYFRVSIQEYTTDKVLCYSDRQYFSFQ